jgi:hypothetical protein
MSANTWHLVAIPLSALNTTSASLTGFVVTRYAAGTAFLDHSITRSAFDGAH